MAAASLTEPGPHVRLPGWLPLLLVVLAFAFQGTRGIWEPDEGRYTAVAVNMLESGDWLVPTLNGDEPHLTKPPLTYWLLAASFAVLGHNEWAARLPGALAYVGTGLLVFGLARRLVPAAPVLATLAWALGLGTVMAANVVSTDNLLALFETAAVYAFVRAWHGRAEPDRRWIRLMWAGFGLAFLTKGPPGLLPLLAIVAFLAVHERASLRRLFDLPGLLVFALVAFTWFALLVAQDPGRLGYFLGYEVYDRVFTAKHDRNAEWYGGLEVYGPVLLVGTLPWWPLALRAAGGPRRAWSACRARLRSRHREWLLLAWWLLLPLAVFLLARSRLQLYVLPLFVPWALMVARPLAGWPWLTPARLAATAGVTAAVLLGLKATLSHWPADRDAREMARSIDALLAAHGGAQLRSESHARGRRPVLAGIDEIAFVGMRPFYGLRLYLDLEVESLQFEGAPIEYAKFVARESVCEEVAERERTVYAFKESRTGQFLDVVGGCPGVTPQPLGHIVADDNRIALYRVRGRPPPG